MPGTLRAPGHGRDGRGSALHHFLPIDLLLTPGEGTGREEKTQGQTGWRGSPPSGHRQSPPQKQGQWGAGRERYSGKCDAAGSTCSGLHPLTHMPCSPGPLGRQMPQLSILGSLPHLQPGRGELIQSMAANAHLRTQAASGTPPTGSSTSQTPCGQGWQIPPLLTSPSSAVSSTLPGAQGTKLDGENTHSYILKILHVKNGWSLLLNVVTKTV